MSLMPIQVPNIRLPATDDWSGLLKLGEGIGQAAKQYGLTKDLNAAYEGQDPAQQQGLISKLMGEEAPAAKPIDPAFAESTKLGYAAKAYAMNGEYEMAQRTQAQALAQREKEIAEIADSVMYGDDPDAVAAAYPKIRNGEKIEFEDLGNGVRRAWGVSELNPAQRRLMAEGDNKTLMDAFRKSWNPKRAMELARQEQEFALKQDESRYRGQYYKDQGENLRIDNQRQAQQLADDRLYKQITVLQNQIQRLPPDAVEERALAMQALDGLMRQYATSLAAPSDQGLRGGGMATPGSPQAGTIPPAAIYDYLVSKHGVDPTEAIGIVANIEQESGFDPTTLHDKKDGVYTGYGLFGHGGDRRTKLFQYAGNQNPSWTQQIDYAMTESDMQKYLAKDYGKDYGRAAADFTRDFERPKFTEQRAQERAQKAPGYASYAERAISPGLATNAPQQGLTATPNAPAPAQPGQTIDPRWMEASRAYQTAAKTPKPGKELTVEERIALNDWAEGRLGDKLAGITDPMVRDKMIRDEIAKLPGYGGGGAGWDANASMGQIVKGGAGGTKKDNAGGLTGDDFATASKTAATGVRQGVTNSALAKEQAKFDQRVQSHANSLRALQSTKASNPEEAKRQARAALADIEGLYPNLTAAGKQSAATALNGIYTLFPELAPQP